MVYCIIVIAILLWIITFVNCYEVCGVLKDGTLECCTNFKYEDGKCIECPKGWFGEECNLPCPNGFYGVFCKETCNCKDDQICDAQDGCVQKKTVECLKGLVDDECNLLCPDGHFGSACNETCNCTADQICDVQEGCVNNNTDNTLTIMETISTDQQTTKSNGYQEGIVWNHLYLYGITLGVVVIVLVILLVHTHRKKKTGGQEDESRHDQQDQEAEFQAVQLNQNILRSDYAGIYEIDATYSHTLTFSSDYNVLSFSRSRWDRYQSSPTESHYDTSKNCLLKIKESESKSKPDTGGDPYSLAKPLLDTGNGVQQAPVSGVKQGGCGVTSADMTWRRHCSLSVC